MTICHCREHGIEVNILKRLTSRIRIEVLSERERGN